MKNKLEKDLMDAAYHFMGNYQESPEEMELHLIMFTASNAELFQKGTITFEEYVKTMLAAYLVTAKGLEEIQNSQTKH